MLTLTTAGVPEYSECVVCDCMKGKLTDQPLAELIREISSKRLSGTLRLEFEQAKTAVYFDGGQVIYAAANIRSLRLREYLSKRHVVPQTELANLNTNLSDLALAAALRASGKLQQPQIDGLLVTLVADVLRVAMLWTEGSWEFDERSRLAEAVRVSVDKVDLLREAALRLPPKFVALRFRNSKELFSRAVEAQRIIGLLPNETLILSLLDAPMTLEQLLAGCGLPVSEAQQFLYGLTLAGLVEREYWKNAFRTQAKPAKEQTPATIAQQKADGQTSADDRWAMKGEDADLEKFFARLSQATTHYEVVNLPPTAAANEIKDTYYALARRYHPDRFHIQSGTSLHARISSAFARITQAYETLTDPNARAVYDSTLERARRFASSRTGATPTGSVVTGTEDLDLNLEPTETKLGEAEYNFREGVGALQQGRIEAAVTHLATASHLEPMEARYRAYYGRALGASETNRRLAETEIQSAVKLEPNNAVYRTMLAELYFDLRFHRRAQTELDRALAIDPNNPSARSLLRKLEKSRKVG
jgi:curved DNA-binding protein CbpA